jgi:TetR/AcrR family transcriptional regulator, repressor for uid operon
MPRSADPTLRERRRTQILEAARLRFRERGFRDATIEEICAEARISPGALYRYFSSKADIIAAIALDARGEAEALLDRFGDADGLVNGLAEMARAYLESFATSGEARLLADIWAEAAQDPALASALQRRNRAAVDRIVAVLERAARAGAIYPAIEPRDAAEILMAALEGAALRRAVGWESDGAAPVRRFRLLALQVLKPKR